MESGNGPVHPGANGDVVKWDITPEGMVMLENYSQGGTCWCAMRLAPDVAEHVGHELIRLARRARSGIAPVAQMPVGLLKQNGNRG